MPPVPGWLVEGLSVIDQESYDLFKVTKVTRIFINLSNPDKSRTHRTRLTYLSKLFFASNYFECDDCRRGAPTPCEDCTRRKLQFYDGVRLGGWRACELPKLCKRKFIGGTFPLDPFVEPERPLPPTRFERDWVI